MNSIVSASAIEAPPQATAEEVVRLVDVHRHFGATAALDGISLTVHKGRDPWHYRAQRRRQIHADPLPERPGASDRGEIEIEGRSIVGLDERSCSRFAAALA